MLKNIEDTLNKSCLIGLSYFNVQGEQLKQNILAGRVIKVDNEMGITLELSTTNDKSTAAHFILPTDLSCWFTAPKGEFHTSQSGVKIINPDYLVTWDIFQTKEQQSNSQGTTQEKPSSTKRQQDGEQQWWQWRPRIQSPNVNN